MTWIIARFVIGHWDLLYYYLNCSSYWWLEYVM